MINISIGMNFKGGLDDPPTTTYGKTVYFVTNLLKVDFIVRALFNKTKNPENVRETLKGIYLNKDRVDDELVNSIVNPSKDNGALKVF